jgi:hypothetical protein
MRPDLYQDFWKDVENHLRRDHDMSPEAARKYIEQYGDRLRAVGAIDTVYHSEPSQIAQAIAGLGFRKTPRAHPG